MPGGSSKYGAPAVTGPTSGGTPGPHAASHAAGGTDPVTLTEAQITNLTSDLAALAPKASPALTGTPTAPTAAQGTSTTQIATTAMVASEVAVLNATIANDLAGLDDLALCNFATSAALPTCTYANGSSGVGATLTAAAPGVLTVDSTGVPALGSSILVQNQASTFQNGVYTLTTVGTVAVAFVLTRRTDFDQASEMGTPKIVPVNAQGLTAGTANDNKTFLSLTSSPFVVGTTAITFGLLGTTYTADGVTLQLSGTQFSVKSGGISGTQIAASPTITTSLTTPMLIASGLTGAVQASRWVGAVASVAPTSGTFAVGDFVVSQAGAVFVCTSAGSPGTWTQSGINTFAPLATALVTGRYYRLPGAIVTTNASQGVGTARAARKFIPATTILDRIGAEITSAGDAGSKLRLGIWSDTNGRPDALVLDAGTIAGDSATVQEITINQTLTRGWYWFGGAVQVVTVTQPTVRVISTPTEAIAADYGTTIPAAGATAVVAAYTGATAAFGANWGTYTAAGNGPSVFARIG